MLQFLILGTKIAPLSHNMEGKCRCRKNWLQQMMMCVMFLGFLTAKCQAQLGGPPVIVVQPLGISVQNGGTAILTTTATSFTSMKFSWLLNGQPVSATNTTVVNVAVPLVGTVSTLTVNHVSSEDAGNYSVKIQNGSGSVTSSDATLVVLLDTVSNVVNIVSAGTGMTVNGFKIQLSGPPGSNYVVEASTDFKNWIPISTNSAPTGSISYTDSAATNLPCRYYRAIVQ
jgi:Immunoglobulin domain